MYRTLIIDDEPAIRKDVELLLSRHKDFICVGTCGSIADARVLLNATKPDLLLLDIQLMDGTAFELLRDIEQVNFKVIFITAYNNFAIKAIKLGALDYIVKPVDEDELNEALDRFRTLQLTSADTRKQLHIADEHWQNAGKLTNKIVLRSQSYLQIIPYEDIIYCQSDAGYTTFFLVNDKKAIASRPIKDYEEILPPSMFMRTHQSYLVNVNAIDRYHKDGYLVLKNDTKIPVATRKKDAITAFLTGH